MTRLNRAALAAYTLAAALIAGLLIVEPSFAGKLGDIGKNTKGETSDLMQQLFVVGLMVGAGVIAAFRKWGGLLIFFIAMCAVAPMIFAPDTVAKTMTSIGDTILK